MMYSSELNAIKKSNRLRDTQLCEPGLVDFASNDYLGFSEIDSLLDRTYEEIKKYKSHAPKSSQMVNGYQSIHKNFEDYLSKINSFESAITAGSGFLANLALIESLPRKKDLLILDSEYHASGILASKLVDAKVEKFEHNDMKNLEEILQQNRAKRVIVAVEGIYSMSGDLLKREIFELCEKYKFLLIVDEAHSVGVVGDRLLGVFDLFDVKPTKYHIKMGTLGKAMGSYGAYILCSSHIREYLVNRAKSLIYATAPSLFDIELARQGFIYMDENLKRLKDEIGKRREIIYRFFGFEMAGLIFSLELNSSVEALTLQKKLKDLGFIVAAIRPPTVSKPILRIIPRLGASVNKLETVCRFLVSTK